MAKPMVQLMSRFPKELHARLVESANKQQTSLNSELRRRLILSFEVDDMRTIIRQELALILQVSRAPKPVVRIRRALEGGYEITQAHRHPEG